MPSILVSFDENNIGKGSGRSVNGINLVDALTYCSDLLVKYGGHELAAGLTVERDNFEAFKKRINDYVRENVSDELCVTPIEADAYIEPSDITLDQANELLLLEPYGVSNPSPLFFMKDANVKDIISLAQKHTKLIVEKDGITINALYFGHSRSSLPIYTGDTVDLAFTIGINEFRGVTEVQMIVRDLKISESLPFRISEQEKLFYRDVLDGQTYKRDDDILPCREDFTKVYLYLKRRPGIYRDDCTGVREIIRSLGGKISYCKLMTVLTVLNETGLVSIEFSDECDENFHFSVNFVKNKIDIERSPFYVKMRSLADK
jgi:single-stranded-DNA-specific exonuclease